MKRIVLASNNAGKVREIHDLLAPLELDVIPQGSLGIPEAAEPHHTFVENALAKARHAAQASGLPALADDSGICVAALAGEPGVHSAYYAGLPRSDDANNRKLVAALAGKPDRRAHYYCVMVLVRRPDDPEPLIAEGRWHGEVTATPRGFGGFGYDPYFLLPELGRTAAELTSAEKNAASHRGQALRRLLLLLREEG
ncbi:MAG TPA: RdgB/HAM1 family non-canonical purine NTP pyrophosphatase [Burkholderiales bacterium]|nr:RdgB/HAM1 family non-canonical purine NTP pyrophosphatase [Betaproteobacteria bacterium]HQR52342.1 RdgB/HAM1 family non-canonical purine NTP pyrophosphatase [Burkholderiales bacterium]